MKYTGVAIAGFWLCALVLMTSQSTAAAEKYRVYFGTGGTVEGEGIFSSVLDPKTGQLTEAELVIEAMRPGFIALHPDGHRLYAVGRPAGYQGPRGGAVSVYEINRNSGALKLLNSQESEGRGPCYLQVDPQGRNVLVCHYMSGNCSVLPLARDGSLEPVSSLRQHTGSGQDPRRQSGPHPHSITLGPDGRYAYVADLGLDRVVIYQYDTVAGKLSPNDPPFAATGSGTGPRHFVFHPSGSFAYVNLELTSQVTAFRHDRENGSLREFQTLSTLPGDYGGRNWNAGIRITPDGRFLYVSNRGHNSIAVYAVDPDSGKLTARGFESTGGDLPHTITMDPAGICLIATDMRSGHASVYRISQESGELTRASTIDVPQVNAVVMLPID